MGRVIRIGARTIPALALSLSGLALTGVASAAPAALACGSVITSNTVLTADVGPCAGDGLIVAADHVMLNLNGHKVSGVVTATGIAVGQNAGIRLMNTTGSELKNGEVTGFAAGVRIDGGGKNRVWDIYSHDNIGSDNSGDNGDGIAVWNSSDNSIDRNKVVHNGPYGGISFVTGPYNSPNDPSMSATGNKVSDNEITNNNVSPCTAGSVAVPGRCTPRDPATGMTLPTVPRGAQTVGGNDDGIRIEGPNVSYTQITKNVVTGSGNNGIFLQPSCKNAFGPAPTPAGTLRCLGDVGNTGSFIKDNTSSHNGYGRATGSGITFFAMGIPQVIPAGLTTMIGNTTKDNYQDGIQIVTACEGLATDNLTTCVPHDNTMERNDASNNRRDGIRLDARTYGNTVNENSVNNNGNVGIDMLNARDFSGPGPVYPDIPGTGPTNNVLTKNVGHGNTVKDAVDPSPNCDHNVWSNNSFGTVNQPCVAA